MIKKYRSIVKGENAFLGIIAAGWPFATYLVFVNYDGFSSVLFDVAYFILSLLISGILIRFTARKFA